MIPSLSDYAAREGTAPAVRTWSGEQNDILGWFAKDRNFFGDREINVDRHLVVTARAGTGKTTTAIEAVKRAPERNILICAFSKIIQEELQARLVDRDENDTIVKSYPHITAKTLHAIGFACVRRYRDRIKVDFKGSRAAALTEKVCDRLTPDPVKKLVSKLHTLGREIAPHAVNLGDLTAIAYNFECEPDDQWTKCQQCGRTRDAHGLHTTTHEYRGFDLEFIEGRALAAMVVAADVQTGDTIDGSDMIFLPLRNGWLLREYDLVVVDEGQDMTPAQLEIALGVVNADGRIAIIGDNMQAIFGFRGADSECLGRLQRELQAEELTLTTTYRCGRRIVELAQAFVPDFHAGPDNSDGVIENLHINKLVEAAGPGDFILSRVNAPLVPTAMKLLRAGKRARIAGQDIGRGLLALIRRFNARSVPELTAKIEAWATREQSRLRTQMLAASNGRKAAIMTRIDAVSDQADMLISLTDGAPNVTEVQTRISNLFTDDGLGAKGVITCSSIHRAKGLEADRVFILADTLRSHNQEELNLQYVAITRAKHTLVHVYASCDERAAEELV